MCLRYLVALLVCRSVSKIIEVKYGAWLLGELREQLTFRHWSIGLLPQYPDWNG